MRTFSFGGYGISMLNKRVQFPNFTNPTKEIIDSLVSEATKYNQGSIEINISPEPDVGIFNLTVEYDSGNYLPLLGVYLDDGDVDVKNLIEPKQTGQKITIGGYLYPSEFTTKDIQSIKNLLIMFMEDANSLNIIMK